MKQRFMIMKHGMMHDVQQIREVREPVHPLISAEVESRAGQNPLLRFIKSDK